MFNLLLLGCEFVFKGGAPGPINNFVKTSFVHAAAAAAAAAAAGAAAAAAANASESVPCIALLRLMNACVSLPRQKKTDEITRNHPECCLTEGCHGVAPTASTTTKGPLWLFYK